MQGPAHPLSFEDGGLPDRARQRIAEAAQAGTRFFTSTFSVAESAVARLAGYEPISQVMGSSIYHVGWNRSVGYSGGELEALTFAQRDARGRALGRMAEEARLLGAHAVVGVRFEGRTYEWSGELVEFTAVGTAVRVADAPPVARPALSNLSVQQLYKLELGGLWPVDVVMGNCAWYDPHADCYSDGSWYNQELPDHTRVISQAYDLATQRFRHEVRACGALGAVGVAVHRSFHERHWEQNDSEHTSFKAEILLLGTAITRRGAPRLPRPRLVLDLGGRQITLTAASATASSQGE
jgi:uncharacterized protein YbjQ (UPF0145 family)